MSRFCVFTPTYNRGVRLSVLFESLKKQTFKDFVWFIVDDGSTDRTAEIVEGFKKENAIDIKYLYQQNGGKQRASNTAVSLCDDELFFGVDSDDYLTEDALAAVDKIWKDYEEDPSVAGVVALRGIDEARPIGTSMPGGVSIANVWDLYSKYGFKGDAPQIYRTSVLKQFPYPVVDGEKFISEGSAQYAIAEKYSMALLDKIIYVGGYLDNGYTDNSRKLTRENPKGYCIVKKKSIELSETFTQRYYQTILYLVGCFISGENNSIKSAPYPWIAVLSVIPAKILQHTLFRSR